MNLQSAIEELRSNPKGVRFADLARICDHFFGEPRQQGTSHRVYPDSLARRPQGEHPEPQGHGKALPYQVRQVIKALERLKENDS